jgi:hypothetical protein
VIEPPTPNADNTICEDSDNEKTEKFENLKVALQLEDDEKEDEAMEMEIQSLLREISQ